MLFVEDGQGLPTEMVLFPSRTDRVQNGWADGKHGEKAEGCSSWFRAPAPPKMIDASSSFSLHLSPTIDSRQTICEQWDVCSQQESWIRTFEDIQPTFLF